ncbi:MAG: hypothetical protein ACE5JH_05710 [Acidobacteriota bacterium]
MPHAAIDRCVPTLLALALLAAPSPSLAVTPAIWTIETFEEFEAGEPDGVAISADGDLVLAPELRPLPIAPFEHAPEPFLWSQAVDSKGSLYIGGGNGGRIYRIRRGAAGTLYYEGGNLAVHALAIGRNDVLYAATSPQGRVLRITGEAKGEVYYEPDDRYIWDLVVGPKDELYAATGERGILYRIPSKGRGEVLFDSEETHIVSLALNPSGDVLAGTDGRGIIYRITPQGRASVLFDSPLREITAIAVGPRGAIYASAVGKEAKPAALPARRLRPPEPGAPAPSGAAPPTPLPIPGVGPQMTAVVTVTASAEGAAAPPPPPAPKSEIYRIDTDGTVTTVWSSAVEVVYAIAVDHAGRVVFGSGEPGRIRALVGAERTSLLAKIPESQVTSLVAGPGRRLYAASSNSGRAYVLDEATSESGTYISPVRDAKTISKWGRISWRAEVPAGSRVELSTRSGNSSTPDATWSDWSPAYANAAGSAITSPPARFLQWRARLARSRGSSGPALDAVSAAYVQSNLPPVIRKLTVEPPGVVQERLGYVVEADAGELAFTGIRVNPDGAPADRRTPDAPNKKVYVRGMRSVSWEAEDPNGDRLEYSLSFRGDGETAWKPLSRALRGTYFAFDSMQLPDGRYWIRLEASDRPSNGAAAARAVTDVSPPFIIDNTPPSVEVSALRGERGAGVRVEAKASDAIGPIARAEYSLDAARFVPMTPVDGVSDSGSESYSVTLAGLARGEHTVIVKVTDLLGNVGAGKATFTSN